MIEKAKVQEGDTLVWIGKCGEILGKVRRIADGTLAAFIDEVHCFPVEMICGSNGARLQKGGNLPVQEFQTINEAPVLF